MAHKLGISHKINQDLNKTKYVIYILLQFNFLFLILYKLSLYIQQLDLCNEIIKVHNVHSNYIDFNLYAKFLFATFTKMIGNKNINNN